MDRGAPADHQATFKYRAGKDSAASAMDPIGLVRPGEIEATFEFMASEAVRQFEGEFVAVVDCRVIAHGPDAVEVFEEACERAPGREPLVEFISSESWIL